MAEQIESAARVKWRGIIERQQASGLSAVRFCRENRVVYSSFFAWKRRLASPAGFVEARVVEPRSGAGGIQVQLRGGRRLIVRPGFDRAFLAEVVAAVEGMA